MASRKTEQKRREFIKLTAAGTVGVAAIAACAPPRRQRQPRAAKPAEAPRQPRPRRPRPSRPSPPRLRQRRPTAAAKPADAKPAATAAAPAQPTGSRTSRATAPSRSSTAAPRASTRTGTSGTRTSPAPPTRTQPGILYEPLAFYSVFQDKEILWLAASYEYSADLKQLTIKTRPGVTWTDGTPFSAEDVAYTLNTLKDARPEGQVGRRRPAGPGHRQGDRRQHGRHQVQDAEPRFFDFLTYKYDIGVYIVPKHVFQGQDWTTFKHFDLAKGWPVSTGPWKVVFSAPEQKIIDRKDEWWADKAGLAKLPRVERIVNIPFVSEQPTAQALITNEVDFSYGLQPATFPTIFAQNPKIITCRPEAAVRLRGLVADLALRQQHQGPVRRQGRALGRQLLHRPPEARRRRLGRRKLDLAAAVPELPGPQARTSTRSRTSSQKYHTDQVRPEEGRRDHAEEGVQEGQRRDLGGLRRAQQHQARHHGLGLVRHRARPGRRRAAEARRASTPPTASRRIQHRFENGQYQAMIYGHGGSISDPYNTLRLYQSVSAPSASPAAWSTTPSGRTRTFDKIVDEIGMTPMTDKAKLTELFRKAMEIWLPELPDIQLTEFHHRIPMNTTYWKNWPTAENPYACRRPGS